MRIDSTMVLCLETVQDNIGVNIGVDASRQYAMYGALHAYIASTAREPRRYVSNLGLGMRLKLHLVISLVSCQSPMQTLQGLGMRLISLIGKKIFFASGDALYMHVYTTIL